MNTPLRFVVLGALGVALAVTGLVAAQERAPMNDYFVYFGTYTKAKSKGIYRAKFDAATGRLSAAELAAECADPSFLAVHPNGRFLYAIDESTDPVKTPGRGVSAYALEPRTGKLTLRNSQSVGGPGPCHVEVDRTGKCVLIANYSGGSVASLPIAADGTLGPAATVVQHAGSSVHPRQKGPHAHAVTVSPDNRFVLCADLGLDQVLVYRLEAAQATLKANSPAHATLPAGSGPRHLVFHPSAKFVYVINELTCTMSVCTYDAQRGTLQEIQNISTLPPGESLKTGYSTAEVALHPSGKFLFGSNRGHNSIVVFAIDASTGKLSHVENQPTQGKTPRHFAVDPTGRWLLAENQGSDSVVVFGIDAKSGKLTPTGQTLEVPVPVCAVFVAVGK